MSNQRFWEHEIETDLFLEKFYRYLGVKVAGTLKTLPISPNQITLTRIFLGAGIFYLLAFSEKFLLVSALIALWKIADKTDGALARITGKGSKFGGWLDTLMDRVFWGVTLLGVTIAVYKDTHNALPWLLLFAIVFGHTLFQNFTFLTTGEHPIVNWSTRRKSLQQTVRRRLRTTILYQTVFSIYYLSDQVVMLALLMNSPVKNAVGLDTLLLTLLLFALFFAAASIYVIYNQYKMLTSEVRKEA